MCMDIERRRKRGNKKEFGIVEWMQLEFLRCLKISRHERRGKKH